MTNFIFNRNLIHSEGAKEEIVADTTKQYMAIAGGFLCRLFPEFTPDRPPYRGPFTVFITDDDHVVH